MSINLQQKKVPIFSHSFLHINLDMVYDYLYKIHIYLKEKYKFTINLKEDLTTNFSIYNDIANHVYFACIA